MVESGMNFRNLGMKMLNNTQRFVIQVILLVVLEFVLIGLVLWSMTVKF